MNPLEISTALKLVAYTSKCDSKGLDKINFISTLYKLQYSRNSINFEKH